MKIPDKGDWEEAWMGLDEASAFQNFYGKTLKEALQLFEDCALIYQEDLVYMPEHAFKYYVRAYIYYLASERSRGDSDAANCFIGLLNERLRDHPNWLSGSWCQIEPVLRKIADHQEDFFDAKRSIYGDFRKKVERVIEKQDKAQHDEDGKALPGIV
jgi:hypothetical protein